ncbi:MAG: FGGY family carbohydrate kinase [Chloroflexota bacterium]
MNAYLVMDIGTSSTKVSLFGTDGKLINSQSRAYDVHMPKAGWAEQDPQAWWQAVCSLCLSLTNQEQKYKILAVVVCGQAPSCVPVDRQGQPVHPAILWLDRRSTPQVDWLRQHLGEERAQAISTNRLDSYFGGVKWLWFMQNCPEQYQKTWKILQANSYIVFKLTGQAVVDPSQAGLCSPCFETAARKWSQEVLSIMGLDEEKLPEIVAADHIVGAINEEAASQSGLTTGIPVLCGGGDYAFACLGAGVIKKGVAAMMLGTAGNLLVPNLPSGDSRLLNTVYLNGESLSLGGVLSGGTLSWFTKSILELSGENIYADLEVQASATAPGADGLIFLPYLMGERTPIWDPQSRGVWIGLSSRHTRAHLYRAVMEGIAFAFRQMLEIIETDGAQLDHVVVMDGGANSNLWRQIFADVLGLPVHWRGENGGTGLGAAFLAAKALNQGIEFSALEEWLEPAQVTYPRGQFLSRYAELFKIYSSLYPRLADDLHALARIGSIPEP